MNAKLVFVSGSKSGTSVLLEQHENTIGRKPDRTIVFSRDEILVSAEHARIYYLDGQFYLRDSQSRNGTFVNQKRVVEAMLQPGDLIEFGLGGPSAQFVLDSGAEMTPTLDLGDDNTPAALSRLAEASRDSGVFGRSSTTREFVALAVRRASRRTRIAGVALVVIAVSAVVIWQLQNQDALQDRLALFASDLAAERGTRLALERSLSDIQTRYDSLLQTVEETAAAQTAIRADRNLAARFSGGVGLIVYSYGFVRPGTTDLLRYQVDEQNHPRTRINRRGQMVPLFGFGGSGPTVQRQGSATGFLIDTAGWVLTNRHVAEPWRTDVAYESLIDDGFDVEPYFLVLQIYFPPGGAARPMRVHAASSDADIAVMSTVAPSITAPVLRLATDDLITRPGEQIVFIGYPTGVHNLLFRVAREQRLEILNRIGEEPVDLAQELAGLNQIQPLVTNGSVSDTTGAELIHTAEATGGGSGGPLIGARGMVVGVHYAAVRSPIQGDPFQTQRGVRIAFAWDVLPADLRRKLKAGS